MNNSSLKKRLLSVAMAAVMVFSLLPATAWAAMAENLPAASGQTRTEQKRGGSDTYTVTRDVKSVAAAQTGAVKKVVCLDLTTGKDQVSLDATADTDGSPARTICICTRCRSRPRAPMR